jgi:cytoskeletal protein RodZ
MSNLEYNGQALTKARRELKLKADDIATELCLSVQQVQAIENNLAAFFHSNKLKQAVIKRYCRFLNIDVNSVITKYELDETDSSFQEIKKDNLSKRLKKYFYLSIAAFITTLLWKLFA